MDLLLSIDPNDEESFQKALEALVSTAHRNGVSVERDWPCRPDGEETPDWAVDIVRLAADSSDDS